MSDVTLLAINPLGFLAIHRPALASQQNMQAAVAEPPALVRKRPQPRPERGIIGTPGAVTDTAPVRRDDGARPPLAHLEARPQMRDGLPPGGGRHHFFARSSFSPALSSMASA
jgi:hypothetical protein